MIIPIISFCLAITILSFLIAIHCGFFPSSKIALFDTHKNEPLFLIAASSLVASLGLGIFGYYNVFSSKISADSLRDIRLSLMLVSFGCLVFVWRREILRSIGAFNASAWIKVIKAKLYEQRHFILTSLLLALIATAWMSPMASSKVIFSISDTPSHIGYIVQARMALEEGQFPIRVAPLENFGFRYPGFQFYSQLPYTLGATIYKFITPNNPYIAYKFMLWFALWIGGLYIFKLALWLTRSRIAAILGGVAYISAPYFLNNIHARGAFTEAIAQGILPIVLFYIIQILNKPNPRSIVLGALAWFALGTTHIITFVYSSIFFFVLVTIYVLKSNPFQSKWPLKSLCISYILGWLLALYFLAPVVLESANLSIRKQINVINPYVTNWMTPLANLLAPTAIPSEPTETGLAPTYGLHPSVGWIFLAGFGIVIYYFFSNISFPAKLTPIKQWILSLLVVFSIALFLTWSPVDIWSLLPRQFWVTQFTFRFLTHVMWSGALLTSLATIFIFRNRLDGKHLVLGILIIVIASRPWLPAPRGTLTVEELLKEPLFRYSGALDYLYRIPLGKLNLYGNSELQLLPGDWIPGYGAWDTFINRPLILEAELYYPHWNSEDNPTLHLSGNVPLENIRGQASLIVQVDGKTIASLPLVNQKLAADISFDNVKLTGENFGLKFLVEGSTNNGNPLYIRMMNINFRGISPKNTILPVDQTKEMCSQKGEKTVCQINVSSANEVIQLPILYYPGMQIVTVNNKKTKGIPINYYDYYLLGLRLSPGEYTISVKFVGFSWANWVSFLTWISLIVYIIYPNIITKYFRKLFHKNSKKA